MINCWIVQFSNSYTDFVKQKKIHGAAATKDLDWYKFN